MTTRDLIDQAVFTIFCLGSIGLQAAFLWGVGGLHI